MNLRRLSYVKKSAQFMFPGLKTILWANFVTQPGKSPLATPLRVSVGICYHTCLLQIHLPAVDLEDEAEDSLCVGASTTQETR